ncbi:MAG: succinate dehydrogenase, cytochrome b556 subunit [Gammaproteobacteria bacterium]|nr:succinate dehydrogenase, cytochrome b556 subunit [Gammaproteobacteria bacterium]
MKTERPVNLSLSPANFSWPVTAMASIAHRLTGMLLFVGVGFLLYILDMALASDAGFADASALLGQPLPKVGMIAVMATLTFHLFAGVKHLLLDLGIGETFEAASRAAWLVFGLTAVVTVILGAWLW